MALRNSEIVDIVVKSPERENGIDLIIVETPGECESEVERFQLLLQKLRAYVGYAISPDFLHDHPQTKISDVVIRVFYSTPPNAQMAEIINVGPKGDRVNRITVVYPPADDYLH